MIPEDYRIGVVGQYALNLLMAARTPLAPGTGAELNNRVKTGLRKCVLPGAGKKGDN